MVKSKKTTMKKRYRRKNRISKKSSPTVATTYFGFPLNQTVKTRYHEVVTISASGGAGPNNYTYIMRANSLFDPDYSVGGHQPIGYDQWTSFYNHYLVKSSKITARLMIPQSNTPMDHDIYFGISLCDDDVVDTFDNATYENGNTVYKCLHQTTDDATVGTLTQYFSAKKYFTLTDLQDALERIGAPVTTNPSEQAYFQIKVWVPLGASYPQFDLDIMVEYVAEFSEPKTLTVS